MKAEYLADWIASAKEADMYKKSDRELFIATNYNEQLILTCYRVPYPTLDGFSHSPVAHVNIIWIKDGVSEVLHQDMLDETYGQTTHSIVNLDGEWGSRENLETVYCAFYKRTKTKEI